MRWVLPLVCLFATFARGQVNDTPAHERERIRLRTLSMTIAKDRTFSATDKHFVMEQLDCPYPLNRSFAMFVLEGAVDAKVYARADYLVILEKKAKEAIGPASVTYLQAYAAALKLGSPELNFKKGVRSLMLKRKSPNSLDPDERAFITLALQDPKQCNRAAGALIIFLKSDLDKKSYRWAKTELAGQVAKAKGDPKLFWQFVSRTFMAHNAHS